METSNAETYKQEGGKIKITTVIPEQVIEETYSKEEMLAKIERLQFDANQADRMYSQCEQTHDQDIANYTAKLASINDELALWNKRLSEFEKINPK